MVLGEKITMRGPVVSCSGARGCSLRCLEKNITLTSQKYVITNCKKTVGSLQLKIVFKETTGLGLTTWHDSLSVRNFYVWTILCAYFQSLSLSGPPLSLSGVVWPLFHPQSESYLSHAHEIDAGELTGAGVQRETPTWSSSDQVLVLCLEKEFEDNQKQQARKHKFYSSQSTHLKMLTRGKTWAVWVTAFVFLGEGLSQGYPDCLLVFAYFSSHLERRGLPRVIYLVSRLG